MTPKEKLIFLDTEAINVDRNTCGVFQLSGIVRMGKYREEFNFEMLPDPSEVIDQGALDATGMTIDILKTYPKHQTVFPEWIKFLDKFVDRYNKEDKFHMVCYNTSFDSNKVRNWHKQNGDNYYGSWFWNPSICVMYMASFALRKQRHLFPNFQLTTVCAALDIPLEQAHDAVYDAKATEMIYDFLVDHYG